MNNLTMITHTNTRTLNCNHIILAKTECIANSVLRLPVAGLTLASQQNTKNI